MSCAPCCDESGDKRCPSDSWITLDRWVGSRTIPNNLHNAHLRPFKLKFTHPTLGPQITVNFLPIDATIQNIKDALGALSNFGTGMTVMSQGGLSSSGKLPNEEIWIWFDTPSTVGLAIPLLEVIYADTLGAPAINAWTISTIREGGLGIDEIQSIKRKPGVWEEGNFEQYENSVWFWRVIPYQSAKSVPDLTEICIQQNRRDWSTWTTPFRDGLSSQFFKVSLSGMRYPSSPFTSTLIGGSFSVKQVVDSVPQTTSLSYSVVDTVFQSSLQGLSNAGNAGTISVGGGPFPNSFAVTYTDPTLPSLLQADTSNLLGTSPPIDTMIQQEGGPTINETQVLAYRWPATGGTFTVTVTNSLGGPFTTVAIPYDADKVAIQTALLALPNLATTPTFTVTVTAPGLVQRVAITGGAIVTGGTYQISVNVRGTNAFTPPLPANASESTIQAAILSLANFLPTDTVTVTATTGNVGIIDLQFGGTLTSALPITVGTLSSLTGGNVFVASTTTSTPNYLLTAFTTPTKHYLTFVGMLSNTNVPAVVVTSSLVNEPRAIVTVETPNSTATAFRNHFEPLNVGTVWKHYIRTSYGQEENRTLKIDYWRNQRELYEGLVLDGDGNPITSLTSLNGITFGTATLQDQSCGLGFMGPGSHGGYDCSSVYRFWADYPSIGEVFYVTPTPQSESQLQEHSATFNRSTGQISITDPFQKLEFAFQVRCLGCHFSAEFNPWGTHEQSTNSHYSPYSIREIASNGNNLETGFDGCIQPPDSPPVCREWNFRFDNVPYLLRKRWGPDGFDGSLINDKFYCEQGGYAARKPPCEPDVVLMGDGYWLEQNRSRWIPSVEVKSSGISTVCANACPPKPKKESLVENPVSDIDGLRITYGSKFSYWGGWIDLAHSVEPGNFIKCKFNQFDLTDIKVLILGGLPTRSQFTATDSFINHQGMFDWDRNPHLLFGQDNFGDFTEGVIHKNFEPGTLDTLKQWLDQPGRVLLLEGGAFPIKFLSTLGCQSTVETFGDWNNPNVELPTTNTLNGTLDKGIPSVPGQSANGGGLPVWGADYGYLIQIGQTVEKIYLEKQDHPFMAGNVAFAITQKYSLPNNNSPWYGSQISREYVVAPKSLLKSYTTTIPLVTPSTGTQILAKVKGEMLIPPYHDFNQYFKTPINYPGIVVELWRNGFFALKFTLGSTSTTALIPFNATAAEISNALSALPNIGASITVAGGPLGNGSVDIWFDTLLTQGQDVPLLGVIGFPMVKVSLIREGGSGVDEIQRLERNYSPSRIVLHNITELVDPDSWGLNYFSTQNYGVDPALPVQGGLTWGLNGDNNICAGRVETSPPTPFGPGGTSCVIKCGAQLGGGGFYSPVDYGVDGYAWGLGLTYIANNQFLLNLLERRNDY